MRKRIIPLARLILRIMTRQNTPFTARSVWLTVARALVPVPSDTLILKTSNGAPCCSSALPPPPRCTRLGSPRVCRESALTDSGCGLRAGQRRRKEETSIESATPQHARVARSVMQLWQQPDALRNCAASRAALRRCSSPQRRAHAAAASRREPARVRPRPAAQPQPARSAKALGALGVQLSTSHPGPGS